MKAFLNLKSPDFILDYIAVRPLLAQGTVSLEEAPSRYLAEDFIAPAELPGFDRSAVDGFALAAADTFGAGETGAALLECIGDCAMGAKTVIRLGPGRTARILTGGMLPEGADCVAMLEYSRPAQGNLVEISRSCAPGDHVVLRDDDAAKGDLLIPKGRRLRAQEIGCLAAFGQSSVKVGKKPVVTIISTGNEVVPITTDPGPGQVRDVNAWSVGALCEQAGAIINQAGIIRDDSEALANGISRALAQSDVVIVSGGSSAGRKDFTIEAFMKQPGAELIAHGVAISPGKPFILVQCGQKYLIGLPGHVAGAFVCARVFVLPLLARLQGAQPSPYTRAPKARLTRSIASTQGRRDYIRCKLSDANGELEATPLLAPSAVISSLVNADGLIICPENREGLEAGELVRVELL